MSREVSDPSSGSDEMVVMQPDFPNYVHPGADRLFSHCAWFRHVPIVGSAVEAFGPKCVFSLGITYICTKGVSKALITYSRYPMFMTRFGTTSAVYQRLVAIASMGFSVKPFAAILSDTFAFFGYTKRWYIALSCLIGAVCAIVYGLLPAKPGSAQGAAGLIFVIMFCIANVDVLSEGHYSRLIKRFPMPGANLISCIWGLIMVGSIIASAIQGPLSDSGKPQIGIFLAAGLQAVSTVWFIFNWYGEKTNLVARSEDHAFLLEQALLDAKDEKSAKSSPDALDVEPINEKQPAIARMALDEDIEAILSDDLPLAEDEEQLKLLQLPTCLCGAIEVNSEVICRNTFVAFYGMLMTVAVIVLTVLTIVAGTYDLLYGCVVISVVLCVTGFLCIPVTIMKANLFGWFQLATYLDIPGALDNFYLSDAACNPGGPQFSLTFYNTVGAVIGNCAGLVGVILFAKLFSRRSYRITFFITTSVQILASLFDIIIVHRWNLYIGIPDHAMYILGDAIVYQVCYYLNYMPMNMLISRLCPKGSESTMFAILASFSNLGASTGSTIGAILMETVWPVDVSVSPCDFSNVQYLIIVGHLCLPVICYPLIFVLIPGARVCDDIAPDQVEAVSFLQRKWDSYRSRNDVPSDPTEAEEMNGVKASSSR